MDVFDSHEKGTQTVRGNGDVEDKRNSSKEPEDTVEPHRKLCLHFIKTSMQHTRSFVRARVLGNVGGGSSTKLRKFFFGNPPGISVRPS